METILHTDTELACVIAANLDEASLPHREILSNWTTCTTPECFEILFEIVLLLVGLLICARANFYLSPASAKSRKEPATVLI